MSRRCRCNWPLYVGAGGGLLAFVLYVAFPLLTGVDASATVLGPWDAVRQRGVTCTASLWFFAFGASIGSFLNVVAYRMPMGLTIVSKPSRCPYCETPILFRHNIPIWGWVALRGRCHACRLPISARYVLVEWAVGLMFLSLFWAEIASAGANLPWGPIGRRPGVMWNLFTPQFELISLYFYHGFLLAVLATLALIVFDGLTIPRRLMLFSGTVVAVSICVWPHLQPNVALPGVMLPEFITQSDAKALLPRLTHGLLRVGIGGVAGVILGLVAQSLTRGRCGSAAVLCLIGMTLGWQALAPALMLAGLFQLAMAVVGRSATRNWAGCFCLATWGLLCSWRWLPYAGLPSTQQPATQHAAWAALGVVLVCVVQHWLVADDE